MNEVTSTDFEVEDLTKFKPREYFSSEMDVGRVSSLVGNPNAWVRTLHLKGEVVGIVGLVTLHDGVGEVFSILSDRVEKSPFAFHRKVLGLSYAYATVLGIRRLQATVRVDQPKAARFIELLGFEKEGVMRKFGVDGSDYFLYARAR
jgi:RimJ/RimL family protein N-acetyltransferase